MGLIIIFVSMLPGSEVTLGSNLHVTDLDLNDTIQLKVSVYPKEISRNLRALFGLVNFLGPDHLFFIRTENAYL